MVSGVGIRLRSLLLKRGIIVGVTTVVIGVSLLVYGGFQIQQPPPTTTVTKHKHKQTVKVALSHQATVVTNTTVWKKGTVLHGKPLYLYSAMPNLTIQTQIRTPKNVKTSIFQRYILIIEATANGQQLWQNTTVIETTQITIETGKATTAATLQITPFRNQRLLKIRNQLNNVASLQVRLKITTQYRTNRYQGNINLSTVIAFNDNSYRVMGTPTEKETRSETTTQRIRVSGSSQQRPLVIVAVGGILSIIGVVILWYKKTTNYEAIKEQLHRHRFEEWISRGSVSSLDDVEQITEMETLADLVDVGIDSNRRVIHDADQ
ncbi:MAG: DUF5305 family protein, partial [Halobacteriaceae archaeon]